jgi:hypothetical protein
MLLKALIECKKKIAFFTKHFRNISLNSLSVVRSLSNQLLNSAPLTNKFYLFRLRLRFWYALSFGFGRYQLRPNRNLGILVSVQITVSVEH